MIAGPPNVLVAEGFFCRNAGHVLIANNANGRIAQMFLKTSLNSPIRAIRDKIFRQIKKRTDNINARAQGHKEKY